MAEPTDAPRAYDVARAGDVLTIIIRREFDFGSLSQDWAQTLSRQWPGPFREVRIDLAKCGLVSSTFFAGLIQLHHAWVGAGSQPLLLVQPDPRLVRNLVMLRLDKMFRIEPRK